MTDDALNKDTRPSIAVYVSWLTGGSSGIFRQLWHTSSLNTAVSQFADVHLVLQGVGSTPSTPRKPQTPSEITTPPSSPDQHGLSVVALVYDSRDESSVDLAWTLSSKSNSKIYLVDNSTLKSDTVKPPEKYQWPQTVECVPACTHQMEDLLKLFKTLILQPLIESLSDRDIEQIVINACRDGKIDVLKLLMSTGRTPPTNLWLEQILDKLQPMSCTDRDIPRLLEVAELAYNINTSESMDYLQTRWSLTPRSTLLVLCKVTNPFNVRYEHLHFAYQDLVTLPPSSIADTTYTHISLSGNNLKSLPEELLQLRCLEVLDVSCNSLEKIPSFLRWNCPKLRELNVSFNQLVDGRSVIIRQSTERRHSYASGDPHAEPQQKVLQLTSHNMYSCVFSLMDVDLSHNPRLTRVPEWVSVLPHLVRLNLKGIPKLRELPKNLMNFKDLTIINLEPEKMLSPPANICQQGSRAIITYLRSQLRGSSTYRHMNLLILGQGDETATLSKALASQRPSHLSSSESVVTNAYDYRGETFDRSVIKVTYHIMDFSREAMILSLYQCFLVPRSVYVCVWSLGKGKEELKEHVPILRNIQSSMPHSRVILAVIHSEDQPQVTLADILSWQSEIFCVENPSALHDEKYSSSYGLPCIVQTLLVNVKKKEDVDKLKAAIHLHAGGLKVRNSSEMLIEELVPRSYTALQSHVESKVKLHSTIVRYGEFIDSFRAISHQSGDLSDGDKEFGLACQFLHDSATIYHYHSPNNAAGDLFFLNLQWLIDTLAKTLYMARKNSTAVLTSLSFTSMLSSLGIVSSYHEAFISIMISYNLIVPLNLERNRFLFLIFLPHTVPTYPRYDLSRGDVLFRKVSFKYLPQSFFSHLISRLLTYIEQLGAQLMVLKNPAFTPLDSHTVLAPVTGKVSAIKKGKYFKLARGGYIVREKLLEEEEETFVAVRKVKTLSVNMPHHQSHLDSLNSKMQALSKYIDDLPDFSADSNSWMTSYTFSRCLLWQEGIHIEFLDGTLARIESSENTVTFVTVGTELARVKAFAFLLSSCEVICEERYSKLERCSLIPCRDCLKDSEQSFFAVSELQTQLNQPFICTKCKREQSIDVIAPDLLLMDFPDALRLNADNLILEQKELGKGVFKGTYSGELIVLKRFQSDSTHHYLTDLRHLRFEFSIISSISHAHIIKALGVCTQPLGIVFPLAPQGSLQEHLELCPNGIADRLSHITLHQIAQGIKYLHSLHIIHRDIKPNNILVWTLHPLHGVHVKITDYGLSQFADPFGFQLLRGTEDYMAPELYVSSKNRSYDEKVDIFSFGVLLYNIVTGKRFIPHLRRNRKGEEQHLFVPYLSIIAAAIEEHRMQGSGQTVAQGLLENGIHPAARQGHISMCISTCMQVLLEACLEIDPKRRPSAEGVSGRLMICVGPSTQEKYVLDQNWSVQNAVLLPNRGGVIAWERDGNKRIVLVDESTYSTLLISLPTTETCRHITVTTDKLFVTTSAKRVHSYTLPHFKEFTSTKNPLPALSSCLFTSCDAENVIVGMDGGRVAHFTSQDKKQILAVPPIVVKPFDHPDKRKTQVTCGVIHEGTILCGSGRYLVGLGLSRLQQEFFKPLSDNGTQFKGMVNHGSYLWVWFADYGEVVVCDVKTGNRLDSIELKCLLKDTVSDMHASQVLVSMVKASPEAMWMGTTDGHLFGFHHDSFELLTAVHQHSYVDSIVCTPSGMLLVFGQWSCGDIESDCTIGGFTVWRLHINNMVS